MFSKDGPEARAALVKELGFRTQTLNLIRHFHFSRTGDATAFPRMTAAELMAYSELDLHGYPGIGLGVVQEIITKLRARGFAYPGEHAPGSPEAQAAAAEALGARAEGDVCERRVRFYHELLDDALGAGDDPRQFMPRFAALVRRRRPKDHSAPST